VRLYEPVTPTVAFLAQAFREKSALAVSFSASGNIRTALHPWLIQAGGSNSERVD